MTKITIRIQTTNPQRRRHHVVESSAVVSDISYEDLKQFWNIEQFFNSKTPFRVHIHLEEVPESITETMRMTDE